MKTTTIREEMTTSTTSDSAPRPHNNKPFGQGEGELSDEETGGGVATVDANLRGRVGDAANEEKIRTTATEKEKERARARATEAVVEATAVAGRVDTGAATTVTTVTMVRRR